MTIYQQQKAMTLDSVISYIFSRMGARTGSPLISAEEVAEIIVNESLPEYSKFYPYKNIHKVLPGDAIPNKTGFFFINTALPILNVNRIVGTYGNGGVNSRNNAYLYGTSNDIFDMKTNIDMLSALSMPDTIEFHPPMTIEIFPKSDTGDFSVVLNCVHNASLVTLPLNMRSYFNKLALYDTYIVLKGDLKKFESISTTHGDVTLNLEDIEAAEDKRNELLELFKKNSLLRPNRKRWIIA